MATEFTVSVAPSGGDYTTLSAAEAGVQEDLTLATIKVFSISAYTTPTLVAGDTVLGQTSLATGVCVRVNAARTQVLIKTIAVAAFQSGEVVQKTADAAVTVTLSNAGDSPIVGFRCSGFQDTTGVLIAGATTSSTNYRRVYPATGAHAQVPWDKTTAYRLTTASDTLEASEANLRIERIQVETTGVGNLRAVNASGVPHYIIGVHARLPASTNAFARAILSTAASGSAYVANCVASVSGAGTAGRGIEASGAGAVYIYNCTAYGFPGSGFLYASSHVLKNCLEANNAVGFSGTAAASSSHNASEDATAPGTNGRRGQKFAFKDLARGNYQLAHDDIGARGVGAVLSGDAAYAFTTDFYDKTRQGPWSIGAFQGEARTHYLERVRRREYHRVDRYPWIWLRALRFAAASGPSTQSAAISATQIVAHAPSVTVSVGSTTRTVSAAPAVAHAPSVSTATGGLSRAVSAGPVIAHAPAVATSAAISRAIGGAHAVVHAPAVVTTVGSLTRAISTGVLIAHAPAVTASAAAPGTQTATISGAAALAHAPAVSTSVGATSRALAAAPVLAHAPGVRTAAGALTRAVSSAYAIAHAPAVVVSVGAATRTISSGTVVAHAPGVRTTTGTLARAVSAGSLILHAPQARASNAPAQSSTISVAAMIAHAPLPSAYILVYPVPPLYAPVDDLRTAVAVDDLRTAVSVDDLSTHVSLY